MGRIREFFGLQESGVTKAVREAEQAANSLELARESIADLQLAMEDAGWYRLSAQYSQEFTREGLNRAASLCRIMAIANPLIKRGLALRIAYIWGQGVGISARSTGETGSQDVNAVVQAFLDDDSNRAAFTGAQAHVAHERSLGTDGNVFLSCFTNPLTGRVQVRSIPFEEITDKITNPEDRHEPWLYKRIWSEQKFNTVSGTWEPYTRTAYYPALRYKPAARFKTVAGAPVYWDAPIYHVHDNGLDGWLFGIGDAYAALPWARAYKEFLEDWALLVKALSRLAFKAKSTRGRDAQKARDALNKISTVDGFAGTGIGGMAVLGGDTDIEAIPKTGATIDSGSGRPLAAMIAAALGISVVDLLADPGVSGNRATAETLALPQRLEMGGRRELWSEAFRAILGYVIDQAVIAPRGLLRGTVRPDGNRLVVEFTDGTDRTLDIVWPPLDETPVDLLVHAIAEADGTGKMPPLETVRLLLRALGVRDVDELLEDMTDDQGNFIDPNVTAGDVAAKAFRDGKNPAQALK